VSKSLLMKALQHELFWRSSQYYGAVTGKQGGNDTTRDYTIYQNLSSVSVNKGDKISIKQSLGRVRTNGDTGKTVIKFLLQNTTH
jgi:DNA helicase TIP49 (TBP-interacting protein)